MMLRNGARQRADFSEVSNVAERGLWDVVAGGAYRPFSLAGNKIFRASQARNCGLLTFRHRVIIKSWCHIVLTIVRILLNLRAESVVFDISRGVLTNERIVCEYVKNGVC